MKAMRATCVFLLCLAPSPLLAQGTLKIGDNITNYYEDHKQMMTVRSSEGFHDAFPDLEIVFLTSNDDAAGGTVLVSVVPQKKKSIVFATFQLADGEGRYLTDLNGDGVLDYKSSAIIVPFWVLFQADLARGDDPQFVKMLDIFYETIKSDAGPHTADNPLAPAFRILEQAGLDAGASNRDLFWAFLFYISFNQTYKEASLRCLGALSDEMQKRYGKVHPLLLLFSVETLMNLGRYEAARKTVADLLAQDPDFVPALIYSSQLEKDAKEKKNKLDYVRAKHPNHWMLKQ
jgi:hypothetical protein